MRLKADQLSKLCIAILKAVDTPDHEAGIVTDVLVRANLRGVDSHGVIRLPLYVNRVQHGLINPRAKIRIVQESPSTALVDGDHGFGGVVGVRAMEIALQKAKDSGVGVVGAFNTNHFGTADYYSTMAIQHDMIGISMTNTCSCVAPWGGRDPILGTNPISYAIPAGKERPLVLDMSTSVVAGGKIVVARAREEKIPEGWILDKMGRPTTDPAAFWPDGVLLPMGGHKGYGLSVVIDILSGALTGAECNGKVTGVRISTPLAPSTFGHLMMAINIKNFIPINRFKRKVDELIKSIKCSRTAPGTDEIFVPGEIEFREEEKRLKEGIFIEDKTWRDIKALAKDLGLDPEKIIR